jgi:predicted aspartyl protease
MSSRVIYPLQRSGSLLFLRASISSIAGGSLRVRLLLDTGASYTTLPLKVLGYTITSDTAQISIMTAGGLGRAPMLSIAAFDCLGKTIRDFSVVASDLPFNPLMSGLLGMDVLGRLGVTINIEKAEIIMVK